MACSSVTAQKAGPCKRIVEYKHYAVLAAVCLQEQVQGYSALSQQLAQDYNVHAATVMGHASSAHTASAGSSKAAAAAAEGQPGGLVMSEMSDEDRQRFRQQAGEGVVHQRVVGGAGRLLGF